MIVASSIRDWIERRREQRNMREMAIFTMSEGLPFRVCTFAPDHKPFHAHVLNLGNNVGIGKFLVPLSPPKSVEDVKDFGREADRKSPGGLSNGYMRAHFPNARELIFDWLQKPDKDVPNKSNWEVLLAECKRNDKAEGAEHID
jgi:hypothetical protein